ncbi:MAG TPA: hypothetical protein VGL47_08215 [Amycolatopsis sp.]|uniref:Uncharacterized protein n=1 Tax=Amycolatopsis nalaikhensis TaxID=715472 RepID=A0ABY8XL80_9PSEU|nr:hypothetical protein [Amycolatopsis sp. 2-2]WIV56337.1 hypothetical protein QP939_47355 [Amycolatopsis sp. 2-2]
MSPRDRPSRPMFGKVDPYCLLAVLPMLFVAGVVGALASVPLGFAVVVFAGLIVVFDSWANRPASAPPVRRPRPRPQGATAPARGPRPPAARPDAYRARQPAPYRR